MLREGVVDFIARLRRIEGLEDVALTTNGYLLPETARELAAAGAPRVTAKGKIKGEPYIDLRWE